MLNIKDLSRPELPKQDNYEQALKIGLEIFGRKDPGRVAQKAGALSRADRSLFYTSIEKSS